VKEDVASAVKEIESTGGTEGYLDHLSRVSGTYTRPLVRARRGRWQSSSKEYNSYGLFGLPTAHRLALEMALHEEAERRAIEGELSDLERAWREAEEIAGISDSLLVPEDVNASFEKLRKGDKD